MTGVVALNLSLASKPIDALKLPFNLRYLFAVYMFATLIVFSCLCRMVSVMLESLNGEIEASALDEQTLTEWQLNEWKRRYQVIGELVEALSRSFGFLLLILIAFIMVWIVSGSFFTIVGLRNLRDYGLVHSFINLFFVIVAMGLFFILAVRADSIKSQVIRFIFLALLFFIY